MGLIGVLLIMTVAAPSSIAVPVEEERSVRSEVEAINGELQSAIDRYDEATAELSKTNAEIEENSKRLSACQHDLDVATEIFNQRVKGIYKYSDVSMIEVIFGSRNISDLTQRFSLLTRIGTADADLIRQVMTTRSEIEKRKAALGDLRNKQETLVSQIEGDKSQIESRLGEKQGLLSSLQSEIASLESGSSRRRSIFPSRRTPVGGVVDIAYAMIGVPYVYGGESPEEGFDCSGLVYYCYGQVGISLERTCDYAPNLYSLEEMQPGDIVIVHGGRHVGIYTGGGMMIHAPYSGSYVQEEAVYGFSGGYRP